jgi:putative addiction module killer protein
VTTDHPAVLLTREPGIFVKVPPRMCLTLAGHTRGGQIRIRCRGRASSRRLTVFAYGHIVEVDRHVIVSGGLGTSSVPVRRSYGLSPLPVGALHFCRTNPIRLKRRRAFVQTGVADCEPVGEGVSEMCIHVGPGYRVYFARTGTTIYVLLVGGDKSTQKPDVARAKKMARELKETK